MAVVLNVPLDSNIVLLLQTNIVIYLNLALLKAFIGLRLCFRNHSVWKPK